MSAVDGELCPFLTYTVTVEPAHLIGQTISHYRILAKLGQGGMGEVYRARDTSLHRDVALKVLPQAVVADPLRRQRFVREARAASVLEHPHIAVIHEIGEDRGVTFIAMELVRGEPLNALIARGPLTQARALDVAIEIAEALTRSHDIGIVHRDLKPANVMLTEQLHAKIIDFGLAKLAEPIGVESAVTTMSLPESVKPIRLPARSPNLNSYAERWVRSVKEECLSKLILIGESSLRRALQQYLLYYHEERNHQGKENRILFPSQTKARRKEGAVRCRERLGGLLKHYEREAA